jgi:hypothetical protein
MFGKHVTDEVNYPLRRKTKMKKFFIALLAVMFVAGAVYASELDFSGIVNVRGSYISNTSGESADPGAYRYYDMEFDQSLKIKASDTDSAFLNWEIHDENWTTSPLDSDSYADGTHGGDDLIAFKRAFGTHHFGWGGTLDFGIITGAAWGTSFGDNANGYYRLKYVQKTGFGAVAAVVQKMNDLGSNSTGDYDGDKDDADLYAVGVITKFGDINFKPLFVYVPVGNIEADEETDLTQTVLDVSADGSFGALGFEAEFVYKNYTYEVDAPAAEDYSVIGLYANVWTNIDAFKVGGLVGYGSYDEDGGMAGTGAGFGFGEDFCPGYWVCDWEHFGSSGLAEYYASTLIIVYGEYAVSEDISLNAALEYMMSNEKDNQWEEATGTIIDFGGAIKLSDNCTYSFGFAQGQFSGDNFADDPDPFTRLYHKIQVNY